MIELLQERLARCKAPDALAEEQALKEILQELILYALWRNGFFDVAAFQGGTSLRILYEAVPDRNLVRRPCQADLHHRVGRGDIPGGRRLIEISSVGRVRPTYTLKRKCMTSPSWTMYSLPSSRSLPAALAPVSPLQAM
jgi:hypothetical protein